MHRLLVACAVLSLSGTVATAQRPLHRDIFLNEGDTPLPVSDIAFDAHGYLWLATDQGVYRYNGRTAVPVPGSTGEKVTSVLARGNQIFAGYADGHVARLDKDRWTQIYSATAPISCLYPCVFGVLAGTAGGGVVLLCSPLTAGLSTASGLADDYVYSMAFSAAGNRLFVGTDRGTSIITVEGGAVSVVHIGSRAGEAGPASSALTDIARVVALEEGAHPHLWIGTQQSGLERIALEDAHTRAVEKPAGGWAGAADSPAWKWGAVADFLPTAPMQGWCATEDGYLLRIDLRQRDPARRITAYAFPGKRFRCIRRDGSGNLWLGNSEGLTMATGAYLARLEAGPAYALRLLTAMTIDARNVLWYAQDAGLYALDATGVSRLCFTAPETITCLYADARNRLWIGTLGGGLLCAERGRMAPVANIENLRGGHILSIAGRGDTIYVASLNGVEVLEARPQGAEPLRIIAHLGQGSGAASNFVYQILPDRRGRVWMATDGAGVVMWDGHGYHRWDSAAGFAPSVVYSIAEDAGGAIWAGTLEGGLLRWNGSGWKTFTMNQGLPDNTVLAVAGTRGGSVVAVTDKGVAEWHPPGSEFRPYNRRQGLHIDSFSTMLNAIARDTEGRVYVPYEHGFLLFQPEGGAPDLRPKVALRAVELFLKPTDTAQHSFAPGDNSISFRYEAIQKVTPERLRYRYRLAGYADEWVETGDESVSFPRLPPGSYRFEVQTSLRPDFGTVSTAHWAFHIRRPLWRTPAFWLTVALLAGSAGYALFRWRLRAARRLDRLQRERLLFEYEHLKSQVNPHFLFNSLNTLVDLIEENPPAASQYTVRLADLYRDTLAFRDRDTILLHEEWAVLEKYVFIQQARFGTAFVLETDIPAEIMNSRKVVPLALQLLVENAIKHNTVSRAHPLKISVAATTDLLIVRNPVRPKLAETKGEGLGLKNIRSRYALLTSRPVEWTSGEGYFTVMLPLL